MAEQTDHTSEEQPTAEPEEVSAQKVSLSAGFPGIPDRRSAPLFAETATAVEDSVFRSSMVRVSHWSVAWSDLMMTMFILFLSMFVYQAAHKEFLVSNEAEVIAGDSTEAIEIVSEREASFPFAPIDPGKPLISSEQTIKKVEPIHLQDFDQDITFFEEEKLGGLDEIRESFRKAAEEKIEEARQQQEFQLPPAPEITEEEPVVPEVPAIEEQIAEQITEQVPTPAPAPQETVEEDDRVNEIFTMRNEDIARRVFPPQKR